MKPNFFFENYSKTNLNRDKIESQSKVLVENNIHKHNLTNEENKSEIPLIDYPSYKYKNLDNHNDITHNSNESNLVEL